MTGRSTRGAVRRVVGDTAPDSELLALYRDDRDEAAFAELVRRHGRAVRGAAARVLHDQADVEDVAQAAFLVLLRRAGSLDARSGLGPWLYGVAHRVAVRLRERNRRQPGPLGVAAPADPTPPADLSWREACDALHAELDRLPDRYRLPLLLCYLEGRTRDEAATALGLSVGTVKGRVRRGLERLRHRLVRRGVSLSAGLLAAVAAPGPVSAVSPGLAASVLGAPSPRASELAKEVPVATTAWKWVAGAASVLVVGGGLAVAATLATGDRPADRPQNPPAAAEPGRGQAAPPRPIVLRPEILGTSRDDSMLEAARFGPGGKVLVTGGSLVAGPNHGAVRFRDPSTGKPTATVPFPEGVEAVAVSPDGKTLAVGTRGILQGPRAKPFRVVPGRLALLSFPSGKELFDLKGRSHSYPVVEFSPDGKLLAVGYSPADETGAPRDVTPVGIWDPATGKVKATLEGQPGYIRGLAFSPDGTTLAVVSQVPRERPGQVGSGHARLWDVGTGKVLAELKGHTGPVWHAAFAPGGKLVATGGADGIVRLWDPATGTEVTAIKSGADVVTAVAFSPDGRLLAAGGGDPGDAAVAGVLKVWDVETRKVLAELAGHEGTVRAAAFSPDGSRLAVGDQRGILKVWSLGRQ
jgi:RNA polymerase sigma factor (sigma-70 family)